MSATKEPLKEMINTQVGAAQIPGQAGRVVRRGGAVGVHGTPVTWRASLPRGLPPRHSRTVV